MNEEVKVTTEEQSALYATEIDKIKTPFQKFLVLALYEVFQYNFAGYLAPLLVENGKYKIVDQKKFEKFALEQGRLKKEELQSINDKLAMQGKGKEAQCSKLVEDELQSLFSNPENAMLFLKGSMDLQALLKSLCYCERNFTIMKNRFRKLTIDTLKECIAVRNNYIAHHAALDYLGWTPSKLEDNVMSSFKKFVNVCQNTENKELKQAIHQFYDQCEKSLNVIGYPPIEIALVSSMFGTQEQETKKNIDEVLRFHVNNQYVLGVSKEKLFAEYKKVFGSILNKGVSTAERVLEKLQYLKDYTGGTLQEAQRQELLTKYNLMLDYSVLVNNNSILYIAYELVPKLKKLKRSLLVHRSVRYQIYTQEQTYKAKLDTMNELQVELETKKLYDEEGEEIQFDTELYDYYRTEYERAKKARIFMDKWLHDGVIHFIGTVDVMQDAENDIVQYIQESKGYRFAIFTNQKEFAKELSELQLPRISALRIFAREDFFVWKDLIPFFQMEQPLIEQTMTRMKKDMLEETKTEPIKEETMREPIVKQSEQGAIDNYQRLEISKRSYAEKDEVLEIKGTMPQEHMSVYLEDGTRILLQQKLAEGGEGNLYLVAQGRVAKIYQKQRLTRQRKEKLALMTKNNPNIEELCWPTALLFNKAKEFVGYLMPLAEEGNVEIGKSVMKLAGEAVRNEFCSNWTRKDLVTLAYTICCTFEKMHAKNILMGDVNVRNILIYPQNSRKVRIVDCDSFQIGDLPCPVGTIEFTSPMMMERYHLQGPDFGSIFRTLEDEQYVLASLIFQILMIGQAPYASKVDTKGILDAIKSYTFAYPSSKNSGKDMPDGPFRMIWSNTAKVIKDAFGDVFTGEKTYSASEWKQKLSAYLKNIEKGHFVDEITPNKFYTKGFEDDFVDYHCEYCGKESNMAKIKFEFKSSRKHIMACTNCQVAVNMMMKQSCTLVCDHCKETFLSNEFQKMLKEEQGRRVYCSHCSKSK